MLILSSKLKGIFVNSGALSYQSLYAPPITPQILLDVLTYQYFLAFRYLHFACCLLLEGYKKPGAGGPVFSSRFLKKISSRFSLQPLFLLMTQESFRWRGNFKWLPSHCTQNHYCLSVTKAFGTSFRSS